MPVDRQRLIRSAERHVSRGKLNAAVEEYLKVLEDYPDDTTTLNRVGDLYARLRRISEAIELFRRAAEHFTAEGFFEKAIAIYKKILRFDAGQVGVSENLADLQARHGLVSEARRQYKAIAESYLKAKDLRSATAVRRKLVELEPGDPSHRLHLAELFKQQDQIQDAMAQFGAIAELMLSHGKLDEATRVCREALELDPSNLDFVSRVVGEFQRVGYDSQAEQFLQLAIEKNPDAVKIAAGAAPSAEPPGEVDGASLPEEEARQEAGPLAGEELEEAVSASPLEAAGVDEGPEARGIELEAREEIEIELDLDELVVEPEPPDSTVEARDQEPVRNEEPVIEAVDSESETTVEAEEPPVGAVVDSEGLPVEGPVEVEGLPVEGPVEAEGLPVEGPVEAEGLPVEAVVEVEEPVLARPQRSDLPDLEAVAEVEEMMRRVVGLQGPAVRQPDAPPPAPPEATLDRVEEEKLKEMLIEADVLARYGLEDKAIDKLDEIIDQSPQNLEAHLRLIVLHLEQGQTRRVGDLSGVVAELAAAQNRQEDWESLKDQLRAEGFRVVGERVLPPEVPTPSVTDFAPPEPEPEPEMSRPEDRVEVSPQSEPERVDLSWLEEEQVAGPVAEQASVDVFEAEEEFFDLASELERELGGDEDLIDSRAGFAPEEQSLEDIVEGFRRGMAETLSAEDYDTHYNLGIAYREMGLVDEAISEFQLAAKDPRYLVDCCSLLASCFTEKGFPELAIKWYEEGLKSPSLTQEEALGLVYELGDLFLSLGKPEQARRRFVQIYDVNSSYRDVVSRLSELDSA